MVIDVLINSTVIIISQYSHISNHHTVYLNYIQFLFVNYTAIKLAGKKRKPIM